MTSKTPSSRFLTRQKELFKRRLWPAALTFLSFLLYHVVGLTTALAGAAREADAERLVPAEKTARMMETVRGMLGYGSPSALMITVPLAAILAIEGFAWLDSRSSVDFYESQPVSRRTRFLDICAGSFLYYLFSCAITLEAGLLSAGAFHALSRGLLLEILRQAVRAAALFLAVYALGVLSVMLTGNVIIAWLAFFVLILYEPILKAVLSGYCSEYLTTYSSRTSGLLSMEFLNPVSRYLNTSGSSAVMSASLFGIAAVYFILAWIAFRLRKNECAGTPVIFGPVRTCVRIAMAVIVGLVTGLFFSIIRNTLSIVILWMLLFTVIAACVMQIIYDLDFRALFRRPLEILVSAALVMLIYLAFLFDVSGYDRFVPDPGKVEDAALICTNNNDWNELFDDQGEICTAYDYAMKYMHLSELENVTAIAKYGQEYTRMTRAKYSLPGSRQQNLDNNSAESVFFVLYRMKDGRMISRSFVIPDSVDPSLMDAVIGTEAYRQGAFGIYHDGSLWEAPDALRLDYSNGIDYLPGIRLSTSMYTELQEACIVDLQQFSYSFARKSRPVGKISVYIGDYSPDSAAPTVSIPVYTDFDNTISFLKKYDLWLEPVDLTELLYTDYSLLTREQQDMLDHLDISVVTGPFQQYPY